MEGNCQGLGVTPDGATHREMPVRFSPVTEIEPVNCDHFIGRVCQQSEQPLKDRLSVTLDVERRAKVGHLRG